MALLGLGMNPYPYQINDNPPATFDLNPTPGYTIGPSDPFYVTSGGEPAVTPTRTTTTAPPPPPDPYAKWGGRTAFNNLVSGFNTQKQGIIDSANASGDVTAGRYGRSIADFLDSSRLGQQNINRQASNNELAKMQGVQGIMGMVGRGIRSGNVMLANKNAGDSSAAGAIANAYGQIGRGEMADVGNQYEMGNQAVQDAQDAFNVQQASGTRALQGSKEESINTIVNEARNAFAQLDAQMQNASLPDRIAIDQEKERIRQNVLAKLQTYDQQLTQGLSGIRPSDADARREEAARMARAGTSLGEGMFNFTTEAPMTFQGTAPAGAGLPIFTIPRPRRLA